MIKLPEGNVHYREFGEGPPIVFVHGLLVDGRLWRKVTPLLKDRFRCIVPEFPLGSHPEPLNPDAEEDLTAALNPQSLTVLSGAKVEPALASAPPGTRFQFERTGYFSVDMRDSAPGRPVFNRTVGLRDTWGKIEKASS